MAPGMARSANSCVYGALVTNTALMLLSLLYVVLALALVLRDSAVLV